MPNDLSPSFERCSRGSLETLVCRPLAEAGLAHGFSLRWRSGRASPRVPFGARALGDADRRELVRELGFARGVSMRQIHGNDVAIVRGIPDQAPTCDALVTDRPGIGLVVETADCLPALLWDERAGAVAAAHAGWRGTRARILRRAVERLVKSYGSRPASIRAALGPAIGRCCYEVGEEVREAFRSSVPGSEAFFHPGPRGRAHLDLLAANRAELRGAGVPDEQIHDSGLCTSCRNDELYSYRKEGKGVGRLMAVVGLAPGG